MFGPRVNNKLWLDRAVDLKNHSLFERVLFVFEARALAIGICSEEESFCGVALIVTIEVKIYSCFVFKKFRFLYVLGIHIRGAIW